MRPVPVVFAPLALLVAVACTGEDPTPPRDPAPPPSPRASDVFRDVPALTLVALDGRCRYGRLEPDELDRFLARGPAALRWIEAHPQDWRRAHEVQREAVLAGAPEKGIRAFVAHQAGLPVWNETGLEFAVFATVRIQLEGLTLIERKGGVAEALRAIRADAARAEGEVKESLELAAAALAEHGETSFHLYRSRRAEILALLEAIDTAEGR